MRQGRAEIEERGATACVEMLLDGTGKVDLDTGSAFLDHMLHAFAKMSSIDLNVRVKGEISHQRAKTLGLALGRALNEALGDKKGIKRYGWAAVPMDESLAQVALDISGRPYLVMNANFMNDKIGDLDSQQVRVVIDAMTTEARLTLNATVAGENDHHKAESLFKALGLALKEAKRVEGSEVLSTKGVL